MTSPSLLSRIQGCLVGAVIGDCVGAPYEMGFAHTIKAKTIYDFVERLKKKEPNLGKHEYTDDTAMARCVAQSLIVNNGKLEARDLAQRFGEEFANDDSRGYGQNVQSVLIKLHNNCPHDVFEPAKKQFNGSGSYGNGGAMRVAPVGLKSSTKLKEVIKDARTSAQITHSNKLGYNGTILQACAVHQAFNAAHDQFNRENYVSKLLSIMEGVESEETLEHGSKKSAENVYCEQLKIMLSYLKEEPLVEEVVKVLGHDISAHKSVSSAVYSFLRGFTPIDGIPAENPFERTIIYAISLSGDTDTIASMAGAIAGAYHGIEAISESLQDVRGM